MIEANSSRGTTSPARRLREFLQFARTKDGLGTDVVAQWIGCNENDRIRVYSGWVQILHLADATVGALHRIDAHIRPTVGNGIIRAIRGLNEYHLSKPINELRSKIREGDEDLIETAAACLDQIRYELLLEPEELKELNSSLDEVAAEIDGAADLPDEVKIFGQRAIEDLRGAFKNYKVSGADGIAEALAKAYGLWILNAQSLTPFLKKEGSPVMKFWRWIQELHGSLCIIKDSTEAGRFIADVIDRLSEGS